MCCASDANAHELAIGSSPGGKKRGLVRREPLHEPPESRVQHKCDICGDEVSLIRLQRLRLPFEQGLEAAIAKSKFVTYVGEVVRLPSNVLAASSIASVHGHLKFQIVAIAYRAYTAGLARFNASLRAIFTMPLGAWWCRKLLLQRVQVLLDLALSKISQHRRGMTEKRFA